ncbi:MAG TPA: ABC transporter substrate-binding protein [Actinomycetota bacterium]|nr:ABC transporter substrate-binding protein [Actinomycetota bacterium]
MRRRLIRFLPAILAVGILSTVSFAQNFEDRVTRRPRAGVQGIDAGIQDPSAVAGESGTTGGTSSSRNRAGSGSGLECARGRNGGATDIGVSGSSIKLGATVVRTGGIGESFLGEVPIALEAVKNKVNKAGGICGRILDLEMVNDEWKAEAGHTAIRNFIDKGVFALAVSPSSQGLDAAIRAGTIRKAGIPVVGADGMLISQYTEPWVWPVAASTITTMHIMIKNAADRGAKSFGLVYDQSYHFGVEGASAVRGALGRLFPGQSVLKADIGVEAFQSSYKTEVQRFNTQCDPCDFVAMLLEPPVALQWIKDGGEFGAMKQGGTGGPQPLFVDSFARSCGAKCNGMWVWTGYHPPIAPFDSLPGVSQYANDIRAQKSTTEVSNPFVQGGYLGMELLVEALRKVGPNLTRARLKAALDQMTFDKGMSQPLRWSEGNHFANNSTQAFSIVVNAGSFSGWGYEQTGWISDPWVGLDAPKR